MKLERDWKGRYQCGCRAEFSRAYPGSKCFAPFCIRHGDRLSTTTVLRRNVTRAVRHFKNALQHRT
jgi:hypothetical protein